MFPLLLIKGSLSSFFDIFSFLNQLVSVDETLHILISSSLITLKINFWLWPAAK